MLFFNKRYLWSQSMKFHQFCLDVSLELKNCLGFNDLDFNFKVTKGFGYMKFSLKMSYLMNHSLDCRQIAMIYLKLKDDCKSLLNFCDLDLIFMVESLLTDEKFLLK